LTIGAENPVYYKRVFTITEFTINGKDCRIKFWNGLTDQKPIRNYFWVLAVINILVGIVVKFNDRNLFGNFSSKGTTLRWLMIGFCYYFINQFTYESIFIMTLGESQNSIFRKNSMKIFNTLSENIENWRLNCL
jgi:hypothetical protein